MTTTTTTCKHCGRHRDDHGTRDWCHPGDVYRWIGERSNPGDFRFEPIEEPETAEQETLGVIEVEPIHDVGVAAPLNSGEAERWLSRDDWATIADEARISGRPVEHFLCGWETFEEGQRSIRALLFGLIADLAWPIVEHYRSDLYHDAHWITEHVNGPGTFYFACDEWGTEIGTIHTALTRKHRWRIDLVDDASDLSGRAAWYAHVTPIAASTR